jgi:hypothetical protein
MAHVNVQLRCGGCGNAMSWCVRIDRNVPEPLRCVPRGGGAAGGGGVRCPRCGRTCFNSIDDFERAVDSDARGGWGRHLREGVVVIEC